MTVRPLVLRLDREELQEALGRVESFLNSAAQTKRLLDQLFRLFKEPRKIARLEHGTTKGTVARVFLKPTDCLLDLLSAIEAHNRKAQAVEGNLHQSKRSKKARAKASSKSAPRKVLASPPPRGSVMVANSRAVRRSS